MARAQHRFPTTASSPARASPPARAANPARASSPAIASSPRGAAAALGDALAAAGRALRGDGPYAPAMTPAGPRSHGGGRGARPGAAAPGTEALLAEQLRAARTAHQDMFAANRALRAQVAALQRDRAMLIALVRQQVTRPQPFRPVAKVLPAPRPRPGA